METQLNLADIVPSRSFLDSVLTLKSSIVAGALPLLCPGNALSLAEELLSKKKKKKLLIISWFVCCSVGQMCSSSFP